MQVVVDEDNVNQRERNLYLREQGEAKIYESSYVRQLGRAGDTLLAAAMPIAVFSLKLLAVVVRVLRLS